VSPAVTDRPAHVPAGSPPDPVAATGVPALARGVLVIRWAALTWMAVLVGAAAMADRDTGMALAVVGFCVAATWVAWLTATAPPRSGARASASEPAGGDLHLLVVDLVVAGFLVVVGAREPWFATVFPVTAALAWGAARGVWGGLAAGTTLGLVSVAAGVSADGVAAAGTPLIPLLRDPVYFVLAGGGLGFVADLLERSTAQVRAAQVEQVRATERAARATERESLGRQIHDSVLQALALVHKRGRELAAHPHVPGHEVARLADLAAAEERSLRAMILRPPDDAPRDEGTAALRDRLEVAAAAVAADLDVSVTAVGDVRLPSHHVHELGAAVEQALGNVVRHAGALHAWVFAELDADWVVVSIRDDGRGFTFDEGALRAAGKFGLLRSIRGRARDMGGTVTIDTAPGRGTELELRVPVPTGDQEEDEARG